MLGAGRTIDKMEHGPNLTCRAACNVKKSEKFGRSASLETLGDVIGNRQSGTSYLIAQIAGWREKRIACHNIKAQSQVHRSFLIRQVLKSLVFHTANILVFGFNHSSQ